MAGDNSADLEGVPAYYICLVPCPPPVMSVIEVYDYAQTRNVSTDIIDKILTKCGDYEYTEPSTTYSSTASQEITDQSTTVSWAGHSITASANFTDSDSSSEQASFLFMGLIIGIAVLLIVLVLVFCSIIRTIQILFQLSYWSIH